MSEAKHTPGPWMHVSILDGWDGVSSQRGHAICNLSFNNPANARLISAAPELLEALETLFANYKRLADSGDAGNWSLEDQEYGKAALAAIAKAKGEAK